MPKGKYQSCQVDRHTMHSGIQDYVTAYHEGGNRAGEEL